MLSKADIMKYLNLLNEELKSKGIRGQIALFGGTVMCLVYDARGLTKDIDAVFEPKSLIYQIADKIADEQGLSKDWLNDSVKGFMSKNQDMRVFKNFSNLTVHVPSASYMLAMKCLAARTGASKDVDDIKFLLSYLGINSVDEAIEILGKYFPPSMILPKTKYLLMEIMEE